jgi:hypothetical protein
MKFNLLILSIFLTLKIFAQGGSDIQYLETKSIDSSYIGKEVKLDFVYHKVSHRATSMIQDTIKIKVSGDLFTIGEQRVRNVDMWYYSKQNNSCLNCDTNKYVLINRSYLSEIGTNRFKFKLLFDYYDKPEGDILFTKTEEVWFDINEIAGIFIKL